MEFVLVFDCEKPRKLIEKEFNMGLDFLNQVRVDLKDNSITEKQIVFVRHHLSKSFNCNAYSVEISLYEEDIKKLPEGFFKSQNDEKVYVIFNEDEFPFNEYAKLKYNVKYKWRYPFFQKIDTISPFIEIDRVKILKDWIESGCPRNYKK